MLPKKVNDVAKGANNGTSKGRKWAPCAGKQEVITKIAESARGQDVNQFAHARRASAFCSCLFLHR